MTRHALGEEIFRYAENPGPTFHHAVTSDSIDIVYCRDKDKGMWFLPGNGKGPLLEKARRIMKEIVEGSR